MPKLSFLPGITRQVFALAMALALVMTLTPPLAGPAQADGLRLKNKDKFTGQVKVMAKEGLTFATAYGDLNIPWADVAAIETDAPVTVYMKNGQTLDARIMAEPGGQVLENKSGEKQDLNLTDVAAINEKPGKPTIVGKISGGWNKTEGNSRSESVSGSGEFSVATASMRLKGDGAYNWAANDGARTANNWKTSAGYDYFLNDRLYTATQGSAEHDQFQNLDLRTTIGQGFGYQIIKSDRTNLSTELGASYVHEVYLDQNRKDYPAGRWAVSFDHFLYRNIVQFFHKHVGLISAEDTEHIVIQSQTGLRFPIADGFFTTAQYNYDWTNRPADGKQNADGQYIFSIGYEFNK